MRSLRYLVIIVLFVATIVPISAQLLTGGVDTAPGEVKTGAINEGSVSGDVNLYSGTYDLTQTLGTVSAINGPTFTLTASYSSSLTVGTISPAVRGTL